MKTIITGLLSRAYNMDSGKIAELFKDGEAELSEEQQTEILNKILEADTQRVENIKKNIDTKPFFQDGYKKAKGEVLTDFEKEVKAKFGIESDKTGQELVDFIVQEKSKKSGGGGTSEDEIKRSKPYLDLEQKWQTDFNKLKTEAEAEKNAIIDGYKKEKTFSDVSQKALTIFNGLNPILPQNKAVADNQVNNFMNSLKGFDFDIQGDRIVVMKDGKVVQDAHGNSRSFEDIVKTEAAGLFEFKANNGGSGSGNEGGQGGQGSGGSGSYQIPKNFEDLEKMMQDKSISAEDKSNIMAEYEKAQKGV